MVLDEDVEDVHRHRVGVLDRAAQPVALLVGREVRREEEQPQLGVLLERLGDLAELLARRRRACPAPGRPRTASARRPGRSRPWRQFRRSAPLRAEKSRSASASSTRRFWSSPVRTRPVTFSVALIVRSATSVRISSIARRVSASMSLRVCSSSSSRFCAGLVLRVALERLGVLARAQHDVVRLRAGLLEPLAVLGEQRLGLLLRLLGRDDRVLDDLGALVERVLDRRERELVQHPERHEEGEERPDHEPDVRAHEEVAALLRGGVGGEWQDGREHRS